MLYTKGHNFFHIHRLHPRKMNDIAHNLAQVRDKISARCSALRPLLQKKLRCLQSVKQNLRAPSQKPLMQASGQFGENYVQEGVDKIRHFQELGVTGSAMAFYWPPAV